MIFNTENREKLLAIYEQFESAAHVFKKEAVCKPGCAYCCTGVGNIDITTFEGLIIRDRIGSFSDSRIREKIAENKSYKENGRIAPCPFLTPENTCLIYDIRPFICRHIYSLRTCGPEGAMIHRPVRESAKKTITDIQRLDINGYSGHISFILHLLDLPEFGKVYLSGGFDPGSILSFGRSHGIIINRYVLGLPVLPRQ